MWCPIFDRRPRKCLILPHQFSAFIVFCSFTKVRLNKYDWIITNPMKSSCKLASNAAGPFKPTLFLCLPFKSDQIDLLSRNLSDLPCFYESFKVWIQRHVVGAFPWPNLKPFGLNYVRYIHTPHTSLSLYWVLFRWTCYKRRIWHALLIRAIFGSNQRQYD